MQNGRVINEIGVGALTCTNNSTVDFVLCNLELFRYLWNFKILDVCNLFSNVHKPLSFSFKTNVTASIVSPSPAKKTISRETLVNKQNRRFQ